MREKESHVRTNVDIMEGIRLVSIEWVHFEVLNFVLFCLFFELDFILEGIFPKLSVCDKTIVRKEHRMLCVFWISLN